MGSVPYWSVRSWAFGVIGSREGRIEIEDENKDRDNNDIRIRFVVDFILIILLYKLINQLNIINYFFIVSFYKALLS